MSEEGELTEENPFIEDENEDLITEGMVKKATYLIHKLANRRGADFREIQKKCKKALGYTNLARVTLEEGHAIINKLIELTGGEEEKEETNEMLRQVTPEEARKNREAEEAVEEIKDDLTKEHEAKQGEIVKAVAEDDDLVTSTMRKAIRAAVDITIKEVVDKEVPVQGLGGFVLEIGKVIFEAKMTAEADNGDR